MTRPALRTALIGLGKVGAGYAEDPVMARYYPYATHAQVLTDHPAFSWEAVVDVSDEALAYARARWQLPLMATSVADLHQEGIEVAIIATPPAIRLAVLQQLPDLRAVIVEKPLGQTVEEAQKFLAECERRHILVLVNYWRRADETFQQLANGRLEELIGMPQAILGIYGNGLLNNGSHMVDFVRMLGGEVEDARALGDPEPGGPIPGDMQVAFQLSLSSGVIATLHPVRFAHYRENSLDIWGERGRLSIDQEGLRITYYPVQAHRAMLGEHEVASDRAQPLISTVGHAFYHLYSNLADALWEGTPLWCDGKTALESERIIGTIVHSAHAQRLSKTIPQAIAGSPEVTDAH